MKRCLIIVGFIFLCFPSYALRIADFYQEVQVGQWMILQSSDGLCTRTEVLSKDDGIVKLHIQSTINGELVSDSDQLIDVLEGRTISILIRDESGAKELKPSKTDFDQLFQIEFEFVKEEIIVVDDKEYECDLYRAIFNDRLVKIWISDEVPILHLVQMSMHQASVKIVDYGDEPLVSGQD